MDRNFVSSDSRCGKRDIAVDGAHIYWFHCISDGDKYFPNTTWYIARANLDGSGVDRSFIGLGNASACELAVNHASIYWASCGGRTVGRVNLDGSGADPSFIKAAGQTRGVAVDGAHIYWGNFGTDNEWHVARANLDGSGVEHSFITVTGTNLWSHVAVDAQHVYWSTGRVLDPSSYTIGRANLDGSAVDQTFVPNTFASCGLAVNANNIFWHDPGRYDPPNSTGWIGRANLDGTSVGTLIPTAFLECGGLAVDSTHIYWGDLIAGTDKVPVPVAHKLRLKPARFRALGRGSSIVSKSRSRAKRGSSVSYQLSEAVYVSFDVERRVGGRRRGGSCLAGRERGRRCTTYKKLAGAFSHYGAAGANSFRFSGRLRGKKLRPGSYRLLATPIGGTGMEGRTIAKRFRIVRR